MNQKNHKIILTITTILSIILVCIPFIRITLKDAFFPYIDPYTTKFVSENVFNKDFIPITWDYLFYIYIKILKITFDLNYYQFIRWGNYLTVLVMFLSLIVFYKKIIKDRSEITTIPILLGTTYYFSYYMTIFRFSMTLRENFFIPIALWFLCLTNSENEKLSSKKILISSFLLFNIISGHMLVSYITIGTICVQVGINVIQKKEIKQYIQILVISIILSTYFLKSEIPALLGQATLGEKFIENIGGQVADSFLQKKHFNIPLDILMVPLGLIYYLKLSITKKIKPSYTFISYTISTLTIYIASFFNKFGIKQDRLLIYIYIISVFFIINFYIFCIKQQKYRFLIPLLITAIVLSQTILKNINFSITRPINSNNIEEVISHIKQHKIILGKNTYCGLSACTLINYIYPETYHTITPIDSNNYDLIDTDSNSIFLLKYDEYLLGRINPNIPKYFLNDCQDCYIESRNNN